MTSEKKNQKSVGAAKVAWAGLAVNIVLTALKFAAGVFGHSAALLADAAHSVSDVATDLVALGGIKIAEKPADENHAYGHGKYETLATTLIGVALLLAALGMCWEGFERVWNSLRGGVFGRPGAFALSAALVSIIAKEALYRYTVSAGRRLGSQALIANAWHHRSDAFSSIAAALGVGGAMALGDEWGALDPLAAVLVSALVAHVAWRIIALGIGGLTDESLDEASKREILDLATGVEGVVDAHNLRTRKVGTDVAVDLHVCVDSDMTVAESHEIASAIEAGVRDRFGTGSFVSIHIEPETERKG